MTNTDEVYVTEQGLEDMKKELEYLKMEKRPAVIEALKEARALGDLSENAEYDAARNEQSETENRIAILEKQIEKAIVIKNSLSGSGPCENIFKTISINPYSQLLSCCGLTVEYNKFLKLGNLQKNSLKSLYESQFHDLYKIWLYVDGPKFTKFLVQTVMIPPMATTGSRRLGMLNIMENPIAEIAAATAYSQYEW